MNLKRSHSFLGTILINKKMRRTGTPGTVLEEVRMNEQHHKLFFWDFTNDWKRIVGEVAEGVFFTPAKLFGRRVEFCETWPVGQLTMVKGARSIGGFISVPQSRLQEFTERLGLQLEESRTLEGSLRGNTLMNVDCRVVHPTQFQLDTRSPDHRFLANLFLYGAFESFSDVWQEFLEQVFEPECLTEANHHQIRLDIDPELSVRSAEPGDLVYPIYPDQEPDLRENLRVSLIRTDGVLRSEMQNYASVSDLFEKLDAGSFGIQTQILLLQPSNTGFTIPIQIDGQGWHLIRSGQLPFLAG